MQISAPAKLNLFLHITGRRADGYHLLESLFVFTKLGDLLTITAHSELRFTFHGPFQSLFKTQSPSDNLIVRAAKLLKEKYQVTTGALIQLTKNIPVGAGLGGGSSDAAATLIGLNRLWKLNLHREPLAEIGLLLGADVPACLYQQPLFVSGIGEKLRPVTLPFKTSMALLIKPNQSLSTPTVFSQFQKNASPFSPSILPPSLPQEWDAFLNFLAKQQNDLQSPASHFLPIIHTLLDLLSNQPGCRLARMSGSGPTCFALFENQELAKNAYKILKESFPGFWIIPTEIPWDAIHYIA